MHWSRKITPKLDQNRTKTLNLTVLQRIDPFIEDILITVAHVTLYDLNVETSQWSRKDVEGSFFVVKRITQPRFQFLVMNRLKTENFVENLQEDLEYEFQIPYLYYRKANQQVNGIWFYNSRDCEDVANLFARILNEGEEKDDSKVSPKPKASSKSSSDVEKLEAVPASSTEPVLRLLKPSDLINSCLEPSSIAPEDGLVPSAAPAQPSPASSIAPAPRLFKPSDLISSCNMVANKCGVIF